MKKALVIFVALALTIPCAAFAADPTDAEVYGAVTYVSGIYAIVLLSSMFGAPPPGATVNLDQASGASSVVFADFQTESVKDAVQNMGGSFDAEDQAITAISGSMESDAEGHFTLDVRLTGGNVRTLQMTVAGEDDVTIKANGRDYSFIVGEYQMGE